MPYKMVPCRFKEGERYRLLVDGDTGVPLWHPNIYITTQVRNASRAVSTMESRLRAIKVLLNFCVDANINLEELIRSGQFLSDAQLQRLRDYCQRDFEASEKEEEKPVGRTSLDSVLLIKQPALPRVAITYEYQRLTYVANYLGWYARNLHAGRPPAATENQIDRMIKSILNLRPRLKRSATKQDKALQDSQFDLLMEIIEPDHPDNPFKDKRSAERNALIIRLLAVLGIRRGELLGIRIRDISIPDRTIAIHRRPDEPADPRMFQPNTKTLARILPLVTDLTDRLLEYIKGIRNDVNQARRHDILLVAHGHGPNQGKPITTSGLGKIFHTIRKRAKSELLNLHPHALRHTWNWKFSQAIDQLPKDQRPSPALEEQIRNYWMGWLPSSGSAALYNHRHIAREGMALGIRLQGLMFSPNWSSRHEQDFGGPPVARR